MTVESGKVTIDVKVQGIPIWHELDDLCSRTDCPVQPGQIVIHATVRPRRRRGPRAPQRARRSRGDSFAMF